jgi:predicted AAA+ superfamily ATPase
MGRLRQIDRILALTEQLLSRFTGGPPSARLFEQHRAFRWDAETGPGRLVPIEMPLAFDLDDLIGVEGPVERLVRNTEQFLVGLPANHVLLYGERGTGKSSAVRGLLDRFGAEGLRLVEVQKEDLLRLPTVLAALRAAPFRFLIFADDLSFDEGETHFRELKAALEGSLAAPPENVRIVATSNRRHLIPERRSENAAVRVDEDGEVRVGESLEEKLALADRFGLVLGFHGFDQPTYLRIVDHWIRDAGLSVSEEAVRADALRWALDRSSRSGRTARQFVDDLAGRLGLEARAPYNARSESPRA